MTPEKLCQISNQIITTWLLCLIGNKTQEYNPTRGLDQSTSYGTGPACSSQLGKK